MEHSSVDKVLAMWKLARQDPKCTAVGQRYDALEDAFSQFVAGLRKKDQDLVWSFVTTSDELDFCVMELMCEIFQIDPAAYLAESETDPAGTASLTHNSPVIPDSK